ncbi:hypothetical protein C7M84_013343 [Penaeus vannamei]|uniref:Uncharacterized protein n=1 Tax=Penaeus vannamei TaxID=6689 RepID=A0A3R7M6M3_PENVA|nr:hypothetical protein C7M84_013343 [Penaeus vannamei]
MTTTAQIRCEIMVNLYLFPLVCVVFLPLCYSSEYCEYPLLDEASLRASSELHTREADKAKLNTGTKEPSLGPTEYPVRGLTQTFRVQPTHEYRVPAPHASPLGV